MRRMKQHGVAKSRPLLQDRCINHAVASPSAWICRQHHCAPLLTVHGNAPRPGDLIGRFTVKRYIFRHRGQADPQNHQDAHQNCRENCQHLQGKSPVLFYWVPLIHRISPLLCAKPVSCISGIKIVSHAFKREIIWNKPDLSLTL
ncbi:hypothetical protein SDC9_105672 [bioreactor metagenome]|uniref:Uncharacterized protein n=1 Tax=bioreactor metagenome TaxID=1076179 RepID=A0A645B0B4_9ZZZZ